jgi:hypothetical protein
MTRRESRPPAHDDVHRIGEQVNDWMSGSLSVGLTSKRVQFGNDCLATGRMQMLAGRRIRARDLTIDELVPFPEYGMLH